MNLSKTRTKNFISLENTASPQLTNSLLASHSSKFATYQLFTCIALLKILNTFRVQICWKVLHILTILVWNFELHKTEKLLGKSIVYVIRNSIKIYTLSLAWGYGESVITWNDKPCLNIGTLNNTWSSLL